MICSQITDASCDHSMDLGVVCHTYNELLYRTDPRPTCPPIEDPTSCPTLTCPTSKETTVISESQSQCSKIIALLSSLLGIFGGGPHTCNYWLDSHMHCYLEKKGVCYQHTSDVLETHNLFTYVYICS